MTFYHSSSNNQTEILLPPYTWDPKQDSQEIHLQPGSYLDFLSETSILPHRYVEILPLEDSNEVYMPHTSIGHINSQTGSKPTGFVTEDLLLGTGDTGQPFQRQGLSLSLCTRITSSIPNMDMSLFMSNHVPIMDQGSQSTEYLPYNHNRIYSESHLYSDKSCLGNSKYLKAIQQLLDEMVNVRMAWKKLRTHQSSHGVNQDVSNENEGGYGSSVKDDTASSCEISPAERDDLLTKKTELLSMLNEVDKRYKQYHHQIEVTISSFDSIAGSGSAKPYTELARKTISCHFRSLRDAITSQVEATQKSLGEKDTLNQEGIIPRLRYVDRHLKQQWSTNQLGVNVMRHSWRPQRGLPESSVSILRAWLFEHFLNPYPKDSEKIMLARQTGLTKGQVSNWFINARVRLWKPMVEEMHKKEFGETEVNSNSLSENAVKSSNDNNNQTGLNSMSNYNTTPIDEILDPNNHDHKHDTKRSNVELCNLYLDELGDFSLALGLKHREERIRSDDVADTSPSGPDKMGYH